MQRRTHRWSSGEYTSASPRVNTQCHERRRLPRKFTVVCKLLCLATRCCVNRNVCACNMHPG
eukprot:1688227-Lingulodinium_polyedra.AAC.1